MSYQPPNPNTVTVVLVGAAVLLLAGFLLSRSSHSDAQATLEQARALRARQAAERPRQEALARQITITDVRVVPWTNSEGRTFTTVRTTWRNNGPKPIAWLYARIDTYDAATGAKTDDWRDETCIYDSGDGGIVQPGELAGDDRAKTPGKIMPLATSEGRQIRAVVTPLFADEREDLD